MFIHMLNKIWTELHQVQIWWQFLVVGIAGIVSYLCYMIARRYFSQSVYQSKTGRLLVPSFAYVVLPGVWCIGLYYGKLILSNYQPTLTLSLFVVVAFTFSIVRLITYLSRHIFLHKKILSHMHSVLETIFVWVVWGAMLLHYTGLLEEIWLLLKGVTVVFGRTSLSLAEIVQAIISIGITVVVALFVGGTLEQRIMRVTSLHSSLRIVLSRLVRSLLVLCAILISLDLVGINLTVLSVFGGALGVGLGFGLQKVASNYISGLIILLDRSLSVNDFIVIDKYSGRVKKISTRYTILKGLDGIESIIPNEMLVSSPVQNLSFADHGIGLTTRVTVGYEQDIEALLPAIREVISQVEGVSNQMEPSVYLAGFGQNGFELTIGFVVIDPEWKSRTLSLVNRAIWQFLKKSHISIDFSETRVKMV